MDLELKNTAGSRRASQSRRAIWYWPWTVFTNSIRASTGGIAAFLHEHGTDSGCGDTNWPKAFGYLQAGDTVTPTFNGKPLYDNYEMHFMVTQGIRNRKTLKVNYPMARQAARRGESRDAANRFLHTGARRPIQR